MIHNSGTINPSSAFVHPFTNGVTMISLTVLLKGSVVSMSAAEINFSTKVLEKFFEFIFDLEGFFDSK